MSYAQQISDFYEYVLEFYNDVDGLYPIASKSEIIEACDMLIEQKGLDEMCFDSMDRESVRMIIEPTYSIF